MLCKHKAINSSGRSRKGAWIEMLDSGWGMIMDVGRSRKGAWIEIRLRRQCKRLDQVAPVRERGLKYDYGGSVSDLTRSLPRGSVD